MTSTPIPPTDPGSADRWEVLAVLHRLARAMDTRDWDLLRSCFTADAEGSFATGPVTGREAVLEQYRAFLTPLEVTQHLVTNSEVSIDGDTASVISYFQAQHARTLPEGTGRFLIGGRYLDSLVRTPQGWAITARSVQGLWADGDRRVVAGTLQPSGGGASAQPGQVP